MRPLIVLFLCMAISGCHSMHAPTNPEIEELVKNMFLKRNGADGGGGWTVQEVTVLKSWKGNDERHYRAQATVKGVHTSPALAERRPDEPIDEMVEIKLAWRGGQWVED